ncbi:hypothetical protein F4802DRAFT_603693 [Xylaria palmicola]|nr:hypothetical protein F4802DRAFT_603693 [Xylaria palmicola]
MSSTSNSSVYHGHEPRKSEHHYTSHPPTAHPADNQSLQTYRLSSYSQDSSHQPLFATSRSAEHIESGHRSRVEQQTGAILSQFYNRS